MPPPAARVRSATIADTMLPAAPVTTNVVAGVSGTAAVSPGASSATAIVQRSPSAYPISTGPRSRCVSAIRWSAGSAVLREGAKSTALITASGRSRESALVNPVTAPPITDVAPAAS